MVDSTKKYKGAAATITGATLDGLAVNGWSTLSAELDQSQDASRQFLNIVCDLATPTTTAYTGGIAVYLVPAIDDVNFGKWEYAGATSDSKLNEKYYVGTIPTGELVDAHAGLVLDRVDVPVGKFKIGFRNKTGQILNATGNTAKYRWWGYGTQ